jgi:hypothetical protein
MVPVEAPQATFALLASAVLSTAIVERQTTTVLAKTANPHLVHVVPA